MGVPLPSCSPLCIAGLCVVTFLLFAGFILVKNSIPPW